MQFQTACLAALRRLALVFLLTFVAACSDSPPAPAPADSARDTIDFVLGPRTKQLDERAIAALAMGADTSQTLTFESSVGREFARGDVLMAGVTPKTPRGLLRLVREVKTEGGSTSVDTMLVPLQLAFKKLDAHVERTLDMSSAAPDPPPQTRPLVTVFDLGGTKVIDEYVFNGDGKPDTLEDQLRLKNVYEGYTGLTFSIAFDWGFVDNIVKGIDNLLKCGVTLGIAPGCEPFELPSLAIKMTFKASVATTFDQSGAASTGYKTGTFEIGVPKTFDPITLGPLVFIPELRFTGFTEGSAGSYNRLAGHSELGFSIAASLSTSDGPSITAEPKKSFKVDAVEAFLDAHTTTSIGPRLEMLAYGAIGPTVGVVFVSDLDVSRTRTDDCYRASQGVDGTFGFIVKFPWRAIGTFLKSPEIGENLERVAGFFGLTGTILDIAKALHIVPLQEVAHGPCATPPAASLPPGTPRDDTFVNPPFVPWAQRFDEPGYHYDFSYAPHTARAKLAVGVDGHLWAVAAPSTVVRRLAIDGNQLSARRFLKRVDDKDVPQAIVDVLVRSNLETWVLFQNGDVARLSPKGELVDAYHYDVAVTGDEYVTLRMGASAPDGRSALVFGIAHFANSHDHRNVIVELAPNGFVKRAQSIGYPTNADGTKDFFQATRVLYNKAGDLVIAGDDERGSANLAGRCFVYSIKPTGAIGFATSFVPSENRCVVGGFSEAENGELLVGATDGRNFANHGLFVVLDESGAYRRSSSWQLGGSSFVQPTAVLPLPTSGYVIVGQDSVSATREGVFFLRLDAQGSPASAKAYRPKADSVSIGNPDAFLTKDAGVLFGALADWNDFSEGRELTRFFAGKSFAKDGALPFAAGADGESSALVASATGRTITSQSFTPTTSTVSVPLAPVNLKNEDLPTAGTPFAP